MQNFATKFISLIGTALTFLLQIVISIILTCLLGPIVLTVWLINEIVRQIVSILLSFWYGSNISLVSDGASNIWRYTKESATPTVIILSILKDPIDIEIHRKLFLSKVINYETSDGRKPYEIFKKILITKYGYHCFEENNFDIREHIFNYKGSQEREKVDFYTEEDLMTKILPELSHSMDESKPQWEEIIVPRLKMKDSEDIVSARVFRYHHGFMDGGSVLLMWANCMTEGGHKKFPYPVDPCAPLKRSSLETAFCYFICFIMAAWTMLKNIYVAATLSNRFVTEKYSGKRHYGWSDKFDAEVLRKIKAVNRVSLPTILAASTGSALGKLNKKYPSNNSRGFDTNKQQQASEHIDIGMVSAILPYASDIRPTNRFTVTNFPLPTGDMSWNQRVNMVSNEMKKLAWDPAVLLNFFLFTFFGRFPHFILQAMMENGGNPLSFSNVPMTNREISLWGNRVLEAGGWPPLLTNTGMGVCTTRYGDHARFHCIADDACLSAEEFQFFLSQVNAELRLIADECCNPKYHHVINLN